jgi:hypothetical protein
MDSLVEVDMMQTDCEENSSGGKTGKNVFSNEQMLAIEEHICYHNSFINYLESVKKEEFVSEPSKPKRKLDFLKKEKTTKVMSAEELHELLLQTQICVDVKDELICDANNNIFMRYETFEQIEKDLHKANKLVTFQSRRITNNSLYFGRWLKRAQMMYKSSKKQQTWKQFLQKELKISHSQANKLILVAESVSKYKKFYSLSMSIESLYKHRKLITKYMSENKEFFEYWSN